METVSLNDPAVPVPSETATVELALGPRFAVVNEEPPLTVKPPPALAVELSASVKPPVSGATFWIVRLPVEAANPTRLAVKFKFVGWAPAWAIW